jgi:hypothetical protein
MTTQLSRRSFLMSASAVGAASTLALTGCVAAVPAIELSAGWLSDIAISIGAGVASTAVSKGLDGIWSSWNDSVQAKMPDFNVYEHAYGHPIPPVLLVGLSPTMKGRPQTDHLAAFVNDGQEVILFEPWAWQGMWMFARALVDKRSGDDRAAYQSLGAITLAPSGTAPTTGASPSGAVAYMSYEARESVVEIVRFDKTVQVSVSGIVASDGGPTKKLFQLP